MSEAYEKNGAKVIDLDSRRPARKLTREEMLDEHDRVLGLPSGSDIFDGAREAGPEFYAAAVKGFIEGVVEFGMPDSMLKLLKEELGSEAEADVRGALREVRKKVSSLLPFRRK